MRKDARTRPKGGLSWRLALAWISLCCAALWFCPTPVRAQSPRTIKVGAFLYDGFLNVGADGSYSGYGYDYLQQIAQYTHWQYEFVQATWQESLVLLASGEIDLMGSLLKTPEREDVFDYPDYASGRGYGTLVTNLDNQALAYGDFERFDNLRVGALRGNHQAGQFGQYSRQNGFEAVLSFYNTQEEMDAALMDGTIQAMIMASVLRSPDLRIIARFGEDGFYFATTKGNREILDGLNDALNKIQLDDPYFDVQLNRKYFEQQAETPLSFTREEMDYLQRAQVIRCVYNPDRAPIAYYDAQSGAFQGISADVLKLVEQQTGLEFEYIRTPGVSEAVDLLSSGEAQIMAEHSQDFDWARKNHAVLTKPYLSGQTVMVTRGDKPDKFIVATYDQMCNGEFPVDFTQDAQKARNYGTIQACLEAVRKGWADVTFVNSTVMSYYSGNPRYSRLQATQVYGYATDICMAVSAGEDPVLLSILNKVLGNLSNTQISQITADNMRSGDLPLFINFLYARPLDFVLLFGGVLCLIAVILLLLFRSRIKSAETLRKLVYTDALTGLASYKALSESAPKLLGNHPERYALVYMDMHQFKYINDIYGYDAGDEVLRNISRTLNAFIDKDERFARVYADKFVLLLCCAAPEAVASRLQILSERLKELSVGNFEGVNFLFSGGVYCFQADNSDLDMACDRANYAKETIKEHFGSAFVFYDDVMRSRVLDEKSIEGSMQRALDRMEFVPFYQPKVNVMTKEVMGAEALVRWRHPEKGLLPPSAFIPLFERNGFIVEVDFSMFEQVCRHLREWIDQGRELVPLSVNFSRHHILDRRFAEKLKALADRYRVPTNLLEIEITETMELDNLEPAAEFAQALRAHGFLLSIDDYGVGYSSIGFLQALPLDVLKLDKSFMETAMRSPKARDIMRHLVAAVKDNGIRVLCEGVETEEQRAFVISQNCCYAQGYLFSRPLPKAEFEAYLTDNRIAHQSPPEFLNAADFERHIWSSAPDFMSSVLPGGVMACNIDEAYSICYVNKQLLASLGYSEYEFLYETGGKFLNCLHPDDRARVAEEMVNNADDDQEYRLQYRMRRKDGSYLWIRDIGKEVVTDDDRRVLLCILIDITDMVALQNDKDDLINAIPGGVSELLILPDGPVITEANANFYRLIGHTPQDMARRNNRLFDVVFARDLELVRESMSLAVAGKRDAWECTLRTVHEDGLQHWLTFRGTARAAGANVTMTTVCCNIDGEMRAKHDVEIAKAQISLALTMSEHAVFEYDLATKMVYDQGGMKECYPVEVPLNNIPEGMVEKGFVHPADVEGFLEMYGRIRAGETVASCEMRLCDPDAAGKPYTWIRTTLNAIYDEEGKPVKAVGLLENVDSEMRLARAYSREEQYRSAMTAASLLTYDVNLAADVVTRVSGAGEERVRSIQRDLPHPGTYSQLLTMLAQQMLDKESRTEFLRQMSSQNLLERYRRGERTGRFEYRLLAPNGSPMWVDAAFHFAQDKVTGDVMCFVQFRDIHDQKSAEENLKYYASHDSLTGLLNRVAGERSVRQYLGSLGDASKMQAFMVMDVDRFKYINDTYGHQHGDELLKAISLTIRDSLRASDISIRLGGDEIGILAKDLRDEAAAFSIMRKIRGSLERMNTSGGESYVPTLSVGVAFSPQHGRTFEALYQCADKAMYAAKRSGKGNTVLYGVAIEE